MHCKYGVLCIFKTSKFFLLWRKTLISIHISWPTTMVISSIFSFNWGHRESEAAECGHFLQKNGVKWHHQTMLFRQQMMHLPQKKKKNSLRKFSTYFGPQWHQSSLKPQVMKEESSFAVIRMDKILSDHKPRSGVFLSLNFKVFWIMQDPKAWCNGHLEITVSDKIIWSFLCNVDDHNIIPYSISQYANILSLANVAQPTPGA